MLDGAVEVPAKLRRQRHGLLPIIRVFVTDEAMRGTTAKTVVNQFFYQPNAAELSNDGTTDNQLEWTILMSLSGSPASRFRADENPVQ
jgi:hypothetical protein